MKFNHDGTEVQSKGDIQANKVSIDTSNIDFIITILSTNLYSNPIQSFLRETVSNGWDSHVEAGVDEPVILELGTDTEGQDYCRIQDFGVGLSPERFNDIYRNIGSSTKRSDNSQIGGFGIGRFSSLAYADMVNITSVYDGIEYQYLMYKDGNSISIDLLVEQETDKRNGVTVKIDVKKSDVWLFIDSINKQLPFFENLYVDYTHLKSEKIETYKGAIDAFNTSVIKKYPSFNVSSLLPGAGMKILLGKVLYPLRGLSLKTVFPNRTFDYPIALKFEIGELEVTPNREEILYTDKNVVAIEQKLHEVVDYMDKLIVTASTKDYDNITDYVNSLRSNIRITLLDNGDSSVGFNTPVVGKGSSLNGKQYNKESFVGTYDSILNASLLPVSFMNDSGRLWQGKNLSVNRLSLSNIKSNFKERAFCGLSDINNYTKSWIRDTSSIKYFLLPIKDAKTMLLKYMRQVKTDSTKKYSTIPVFKYDSKIFKLVARHCIDNLQKLQVITNSSVPQSYIDKKKADARAARALAQKSNVDWKQNMNLYPLRESETSYFTMVADSKLVSLGDLKSTYKEQVIYAEKDNKQMRRLASILLNTKLKFVEVAPTKMKLLTHLQNFIKLDDFMKNPKYKGIRNLATAKRIDEEIPRLKELFQIRNLEKVSPELKEVVTKLQNFRELHLSRYRSGNKEELAILNDICSICAQKNWYNYEMLGLMNGNKKLINNSQFMLEFTHNVVGSGVILMEKQIPTIIDYIMARKLFIPNRETLKEIRKSQQK